MVLVGLFVISVQIKFLNLRETRTLSFLLDLGKKSGIQFFTS